MSENSGCGSGSCSAGGDAKSWSPEQDDGSAAIKRNLDRIKHTIIVMSGKGGVGKSTVAVNLATALTEAGNKVGLIDVDFHGPTVPTMLDLVGRQPVQSESEMLYPVETEWGLKVISIGFFLRDQNDALIWRGPMKAGAIKQLLRDVQWGDLDYLLVDCPPGTGDEPLSIVQLLEKPTGAIIVTTPQEVSLAAVRKSITFCRQMKLPRLWIVENMSGYLCPHCHKTSTPFQQGGGVDLAKKEKIPFLGTVPLSVEVGPSGDDGMPVALKKESPAGGLFREMAKTLSSELEENEKG